MTVLVGEVLHLLIGGLSGVAQDELAVGLADGQVSTLLVIDGATTQLSGVRGTRGSEPASQTTVGDRSQVVAVGHRGVLEPGRQELVEHTGSEQGGVEVTVARRAPLQGGVLLPLNRGESLGVKLGLLILQEVQVQSLDG